MKFKQFSGKIEVESILNHRAKKGRLADGVVVIFVSRKTPILISLYFSSIWFNVRLCISFIASGKNQKKI